MAKYEIDLNSYYFVINFILITLRRSSALFLFDALKYSTSVSISAVSTYQTYYQNKNALYTFNTSINIVIIFIMSSAFCLYLCIQNIYIKKLC